MDQDLNNDRTIKSNQIIAKTFVQISEEMIHKALFQFSCTEITERLISKQNPLITKPTCIRVFFY